MHSSVSLRLGAALVLAATTACADVPVPTAPLAPTETADARAAESTTDENVAYSPLLAQINARLAAADAPYRVGSAELRIAGDGWNNNVTSTLLLANDRTHSFGAEWVKGDPRRGGNIGVTYAFGSNTAIAPVTRDPNGSNVRLVTSAEQAAYIDEAMSAWRNIGVLVEADHEGRHPRWHGSGHPRPARARSGAEPELRAAGGHRALRVAARRPGSACWRAAGGDNIIGVTMSFGFVDNAGNFTDIDRNGKADLSPVGDLLQRRLLLGKRCAERRGLLLHHYP